jgi:hypothetical protein
MSLSSENMLKLMAYADGELEGAERIEAEMLLASDASAVTFIEQVAGLGALVELGHEDRHGKAIAGFDVTSAVMAAVAKETPAAADTARATNVTSLAEARARAGAKDRPAGGSGLKIGVAVAAALALAASVFVFTQHHRDEVPMAAAPAPAQALPSSGGPGVAIESAGKSVSVFYLPTESELSTSVVVWVDETGEK